MRASGSASVALPRWRSVLPSVSLWSLLALIFVALHYKFYFKWSFYEGGDFAANALQIRRAKALEEIYGNYSRFGFHHPGPAFFYVYAAGERLLFDILKVVPTPFAAHSLAGVLLQVTFFTWALRIVARRVQRPLTLPLLLLFGSLYFGTVNHFLPNAAFQSIWSPHVLLMPFLCFLVAGASVAAGSSKDLVPLVLAGCFLVHGHVAQPFFVIPLAVLAYGGWWSGSGRNLRSFARYVVVPHAVAAAIIAVFVLPLLLDALKGKQSNLWLIIQHFREHSPEHKTLAQSVLYCLSFLCHVVDPEKFCDQLTFSSLEFVRARWYFLVLWAVVMTATFTGLRFTRRSGGLAGAEFTRWLTIFFAAASLLTLIWAKWQTSSLVEFNAHFNFAILFLVFVLLAIAIASLRALRSATSLARVAFVCSLPLMFAASGNFRFAPDFAAQPPFTVELDQHIQRLAAEDAQPGRTKFLLFDHDDWGEAVRVALALERRHYPFRVRSGWEVIFGRGRGLDPHRAFNNHKIGIWRVKSASSGPDWLHTSVKEVEPDGGEILFSTAKVNAREYATFGWAISDGPYSWSVAKQAFVRFVSLPAKSDVHIACEATPVNDYQVMFLSFNGQPSATFEIRERTNVNITVPAALWNQSTTGVLEFGFPLALPPAADDASADPEELGCAVTAIRFRSTPYEPSPRL